MNINEQLLNLIPDLQGKNIDYINSVSKTYDTFLQRSQIPNVCYGFNKQNIIPVKLNKVFQNMYYAVSNRYSFLFMFPNYQNISYLCYLMLQAYFKQCILQNETPEILLYIDTKLLVEDYKRLMNFKQDELSLAPIHSLETLYKDIEEAPLVMWDKLMMIDSNFDKDKVLDIITIRNRKGLSNFYFGIENTSLVSSVMGANISNEMYQSLDLTFDCTMNNIDITDTKEVERFQ